MAEVSLCPVQSLCVCLNSFSSIRHHYAALTMYQSYMSRDDHYWQVSLPQLLVKEVRNDE